MGLTEGQEVTERVTEGAVRNMNEQLGDPVLDMGLIDTEASACLHLGTSGTRDKARLECVARDGVRDCLTALPSQAFGLVLRAREFPFAIKYGLGIAVFNQEAA